MDQFDDLKLSDSDDDEGAGERVRLIMEEIYKNQDKIKSEKDIEEMAERCTNMMTQMRNEAYLKKKEKKGQRSSGAGDKASPPPSRLSSVKDSPRKDSTKAAGNSLFPSPNKSNQKSQMESKKKAQKPNFSEMYKEKMEKMRVPGKMDLKGTHTKTDSTKTTRTIKEPVMWGLTKKTSTKLDEAHFKDAVDRMKENGVRVKGKEGESSVDRIIKTITKEESSDESVSNVYASSESSYDSDIEIASDKLEEDKLFADKLLKELEKEKPLGAIDISDLRKPYASWLEREKSELKLGGYTTKDGTVRKKKNRKKYDEKLVILSDESEPSGGSWKFSDIESDPDDPFSQTPEGKEIMKKMSKIKTDRSVEENELKKKIEELTMDGSGFKPYREGLSSAIRPPIEWCTLAKAQAESRNHREWIGEVKDIDSLWFRDVCDASERERKSGGGME